MRFLLILGALLMSSAANAQPKTDWKLVIHGGAGTIRKENITDEKEREIRAALDRALAAGSAILESGGAALDAVEASVKVLEDDPNFNAGRGSVFTYNGHIEHDASIMDGRTRAAGAVTGVTRTKNPISLARAVMEKSEHVFLSREGADEFSRQQGLAQVPRDYFETPERRRQLEEFKTKKVSALEIEYKFGTVGAVALDSQGHVAAATSTGGLTAKRWGRIGDAPLIGCGTYADDRAAAVSATGLGEIFIRAAAAHELCARVRIGGAALQEALDGVLAEVKALGGNGGLIAVSPSGEAAWGFTTPGMYRGMVGPDGRVVGIYDEESER